MSLSAFVYHLLFALGLTGISWLSTRYMLHHAGIMDVPNARSSHQVPTPRAGGVAIVLTFIGGVLAIFLVADTAQIKQEYFWGFLFSAVLIALISFYDDLKHYSFTIKLVTHVIAVAVVIGTGIVLDQLAMPVIGLTQLHWVGGVVTFFWLLGLTNAYNFMDGIDGLAASTAIIVCAFFAWITFHQGSYFIYILSYTIMAGAAGFLIWNRPPARIFMGDVGSAFLGFVFACMAIIAARYDQSHTSFMVMPMLLLHYIFDTSFTMGRRALAGENIAEAHRSHLYQLLVQMGLSHGRVSLIYGGLAVIQGVAAMALVQTPGDSRLGYFLPFLLVYSLAALVIIRLAKSKGIL